ncbi:MAG: hypothetical protein AMXMBFR33_69040 [Candidatus Xenobia bacterium]
MSQDWIPQWRSQLAARWAEEWDELTRARAARLLHQPLTSGDEPAPALEAVEGLQPPPLENHSLHELAALGHGFVFELEQALEQSTDPEVIARLEAVRDDHLSWLAQRRQALKQLSEVASSLEQLQHLVHTEAGLALGGPQAVKLRLERWI